MFKKPQHLDNRLASVARGRCLRIATLAVALLFALGLNAGPAAFGMGGGGGNNTVITAPASAAFGRVLLGQTPSLNATLTKMGSNTTTYSATVAPANPGATVIAGGSIGNANPASEIITFNLQNNANGSSTSGLKSYSIVIDNLAGDGGPGQGVNDPNDTISVTATVVANRDLTGGATANLGRTLLTINTASVNTTIEGGAADDDNATRVNVNNGSASSGGVTVTRSGGTQLINTANESATVGVVGNFATTGAKSGSVNAASLLSNGETSISGSPTVDTSVLINYTATAVENRDLSQQGAAVDLGNVLVGFDTIVGTATIAGGAEDDDNATRVTLQTGNVTDNEVTVGGGSVFNFNGASQTTTRDVTGNFSSSGAKSGAVNIASQLVDAETAISGTVTLDNSVAVAFTATAYDAAALTDNTATTLDSGSSISIVNVAGAFRSAAFVDQIAASAGWAVNNLAVGNSIAAGSGTPSATITHDDTGLLNNHVVTGTLAIALENDQSITGAAHQDLGTLNWNLSHTVSGQSGAQSALIEAGDSFADLSGTSDAALVSIATILAGGNDNGPDTTVVTSWRNRVAGETAPLNTTNPLVSDVVDLTGTADDVFVLELTYDPSELTGLEAAAAAAGNLFLGWLDGGVWKNAVAGNLGTNTLLSGFLNYQGSWAASGAGLTLGAWGVDIAAHAVWAVLDHNSEFAATQELDAEDSQAGVPEPSTFSMAVLGLAVLAGYASRRSRRRRT